MGEGLAWRGLGPAQSDRLSEKADLDFCVCSSRFRMNWLVSMKRSTQFTKHVSARLSSLGPGLSMHFSCTQRGPVGPGGTAARPLHPPQLHLQPWNTLPAPRDPGPPGTLTPSGASEPSPRVALPGEPPPPALCSPELGLLPRRLHFGPISLLPPGTKVCAASQPALPHHRHRVTGAGGPARRPYPAELGHLVHQLLEALLLRLHLDEALELGVGPAQPGGGRRVHGAPGVPRSLPVPPRRDLHVPPVPRPPLPPAPRLRARPRRAPPAGRAERPQPGRPWNRFIVPERAGNGSGASRGVLEPRGGDGAPGCAGALGR